MAYFAVKIRKMKGRGAQSNTDNRFDKQKKGKFWDEGIDDWAEQEIKTSYTEVFPKTILNLVDNEDLFDAWSLNPYQGCEHGCIYCYARSSHEYWGFSAGLDFETKILAKLNAAELLKKTLSAKNYKPRPIMISGNTDCYQPLERKLKITRKVLEVLEKQQHPFGIITKNTLILRDLDIIKPMAAQNRASVNITITSLDEDLRMKLEPRTSTYKTRLELVEKLSAEGIPVNVMMAPVIPGLTDHEITKLLKTVAERGANSAAFTMVRLNGAVGKLFTDWIKKHFPDKAEKVLNQIREVHGGQLSDHRFGTRMRGEGKLAESIRILFSISKKKYFKPVEHNPLDFSGLKKNISAQLSIFDS